MKVDRDFHRSLGGANCRCQLINDADFRMRLSALFCVAGVCLVEVAEDRLLVVVWMEVFKF